MDKLRVATYYESRLGRNDGNPLYVTACLKRMQEKGLIDVDHLAPFGDLTHYGTYDAHVWVDWGEDGLKGYLPYEPTFPPGHPLIYWASDTHLGYDYRMQCAKQADIAFVAQKAAIEPMKRDGVANPIWLPHAFEPLAYPKYDLASKKYDVCFIGHVNSQNRLEALDRIFREFPNFFYGQRLFEEAARKFAESKIVFNIAMKEDTNMRCFEALGSGSFLLTDWVPDIDELFQDGKHLVFYRTLDEAVDKAKYYLSHDPEREKIAQAGYEHVLANHTIQHRVDKMLSELAKLKEIALCKS